MLRSLLTGKPVTFHGEFFDLDDASIVPGAALARAADRRRTVRCRGAPGRAATATVGSAMWNSARRFAEVVAAIDEQAAAAGRADHPRAHAMQVWCGIADEA